MRVATIFDTTHRPDTTGIYCQRALESLVDACHFEPTQWDRIPRSGFDLYLLIDDGLHYEVPHDLRPLAWWAIDTHLDAEGWYQRMATQCDVVFAAQRNGVDALSASAPIRPHWLPLACDPTVHRKHDVDKLWDVVFVGHPFGDERVRLLKLIERRFEKAWIGQAYFDEMARIYSQARVVFNRSIRDDVNMRVFEALACGSMLITNALPDNGLQELFCAGTHIEAYSDADELFDKITFYLARDALRERIAGRGQAEAVARHTYAHRMRAILETVERQKRSVPVPPWSPHDEKSSPSQSHTTKPSATESRRILQVSNAQDGDPSVVKRLFREWPEEEWNAEFVRCSWEAVIDETIGPRQAGDVHESAKGRRGSFDRIVLERYPGAISQPLRLLRALRSWLKPDGMLLACVSDHEGSHAAKASAANGCPAYDCDDRGNDTRFRAETEKLFFRAGFSCEIDKAPEAQSGARMVRANVSPVADWGLTSIVIVTHNEWPYTKQCLESIQAFTDEAYEIILVDNASTDETVDYVRSLGRITLIENASNAGFPAAANQGIRHARGRQILLLNNDVIVTTSWLARLLRSLYCEAAVGLVGPTSNRVSGPQQIDANYADSASLDAFAWRQGQLFDGVREATDRLVGFCLLIRREVIERVGLLDERFGIGNFEDDDFCRRVIAAGYKALIARDSFVHHFGSRTFLGAGIDHRALLDKNQRLYEEKWGGPQPCPKAAPQSQDATGSRQLFELHWLGSGGLLLERAKPHLSLCMIVRDNAQTLPACLDSIRPWVDEMVVVDTGSRDTTPQNAASCGARVFHFPWCDSFAAARNESIRHARGEWIFWMDSDDTISAENGAKLRALIAGSMDPSVCGFVMQVHCPGPGVEGECDVTVVDHVKLFRNVEGLRFEGRIHEQVLPAIRRRGGQVAWSDVCVVHSGADHSQEGTRRKQQRDLRLLRLELEEHPNHPFVLFNLGMTFADMRDHVQACDFLRASIKASGQEESHLRKAYALLVCSLSELERFDEASEVLKSGRAIFPTDPELLFREGMLLHQFGDLKRAETAYRCLLEKPAERHFSSIDRGIVGFKARHNLAIVYTDMGDLAGAEQQWRSVVGEVPCYRDGWAGLGDALLRQRRFAEAASVAEKCLGDEKLQATGRLLRGEIAKCQSRWDDARREFYAAACAAPDDQAACAALAQFLFEHADPPEAERALLNLLRHVPDDAATHHNLGTVYLRMRRFDQAVASYKESLRRRSDASTTHTHLGLAFKGAGDMRSAVDCWKEALRLNPSDKMASDELKACSAARPLAVGAC